MMTEFSFLGEVSLWSINIFLQKPGEKLQ